MLPRHMVVTYEEQVDRLQEKVKLQKEKIRLFDERQRSRKMKEYDVSLNPV